MVPDSRLLLAFGNRVRELRQHIGVSQEDFAATCELDRTYISGIERGKRNVSLQNIAVLARNLNVTIAELFKGIK